LCPAHSLRLTFFEIEDQQVKLFVRGIERAELARVQKRSPQIARVIRDRDESA
jgi:hypothetical protein